MIEEVWFRYRAECLRKRRLKLGERFDQPVLVPIFKLVPTALHRIQFRKMRREIPDFQFVTLRTLDRCIIDSIYWPSPTHVLPEILGIEVRCLIEQHDKLLAELLFESLY
jgi:hypothetical protein